MSKKHKKVCTTLNFIEYFLILVSTIAWCVSVFAFPFLVGTPLGIASSAIELKTCAITARIKRYKSVIEKNKIRYDKIVKLDTIEV